MKKELSVNDALDGKNLLYTLINNMPDFIYIKDEKSRFIVANKKLADVMHFEKPEDLVGKMDMDYYPKELAQKFFNDEQLILKSKKPLINCIEDGLNEKGNKIILSTTKIPIFNKNNDVIGIIGIGRDVTDLKNAQEEIKEREVQLAHESGKAEIVSDILHNIGNVLNSVTVAVLEINRSLEESKISSLVKLVNLVNEHQHDLPSYIESDEKGKVIPVLLNKISNKLIEEQIFIANEVIQLEKRLEVIIHILELQRGVSKNSLFIKSESVNEMLDVAIDILHSKLENRNILVLKNVDFALKINCIRSKIIHVFVNFLKNSIESFDECNTSDFIIEVEGYETENKIVVRFKDNGIGINSDDLNKIFNHGFTTKQSGYGFGLHSCANAIQEINGKIFATSEGQNKGCIITIELSNN